MLARALPSALCLSLLGCGGASNAPGPNDTQPPAAAPTPAAEPTPAPLAKDPMPTSALPWAVAVSEGPVLGCRVDGVYVPTEKCPDEVFGVHVTTEFADAPVVLTTGETSLGPSNDEACPQYRTFARLPRTQTRLGRAGSRPDPADSAVSEWLNPLRTGGLKLKDLRAVDLDGDGTDEHLFALDTHPEEHFIAGPATLGSIVGVRTVLPDGTAVITELYRSEGTIAEGEQTEQGYGAGNIHGVTDIEGDGVLEVLVTGGRIGTMEWSLHSIVAGGSAEILRVECHWN